MAKPPTHVHEKEKEQAQDISPVESFRRLIANADAAIAETQNNTNAANERLSAAHARLDSIADELTASKLVHDEIESQLIEMETQLLQARTAEALAKGAGRERHEEAMQRVAGLEVETRALRQRLEQAQAHHTSHQTKATAEKEALHTQIVQDEEELVRLAQQMNALEIARDQAHDQYGLALRDELIPPIESLKKRVDELDDHLLSARIELTEAQLALERQLKPWPRVARDAVSQHGRPPRKIEDQTSRVLQAYITYLEELAQVAGHPEKLQPTQNMTRQRMFDLLVLSLSQVDLVLSKHSESVNFCESRRADVQRWLDEHERALANGWTQPVW